MNGTDVGSVTPLAGSRCGRCGRIAFPATRVCRRCGTDTMSTVVLSLSGRVWAHTVQRSAPKSPPYVAPVDGFAPFAVGYVELPEGVRVEALLSCASFDDLAPGVPVTLVSSWPVPQFQAVHGAEPTR